MLSALSAAGGLLASVRVADAFLQDTWTAGVDESMAGSAALAVASAFITSARTRSDRDPMKAISGLLESLRPRLGPQAILQGVLRELLRLARAREVIVALDNRASGRMLVVTLTAGEDGVVTTVPRLPARARSTYFFDWPSDPTGPDAPVSPPTEDVRVLPASALDSCIPPRFQAAHAFRDLYAVAFRCGDEWHGRMFLLDPEPRRRHDAFLKHFELVLRQLLPSVAGVCDVHAIRRRAAAQERARLGRELHDGIAQGLLSIDLDLDLLRRRAQHDPTGLAESIEQVQDRLRGEMAGLRLLLQRARSHDVDAYRLPDVIAEVVERFERETGIAAQHISTIGDVCLPTRVCGEIVRIVQEALVNVRRHSGARRVRVEFEATTPDELTLSIEDDGRGFRMLSPSQSLSNIRAVRPPAVINERVHSIGGRVRVTAPNDCGARLEITLPRNGPWTASA